MIELGAVHVTIRPNIRPVAADQCWAVRLSNDRAAEHVNTRCVARAGHDSFHFDATGTPWESEPDPNPGHYENPAHAAPLRFLLGGIVPLPRDHRHEGDCERCYWRGHAEKAEAAVARVRALADGWARFGARGNGEIAHVVRELRKALNGQESGK